MLLLWITLPQEECFPPRSTEQPCGKAFNCALSRLQKHVSDHATNTYESAFVVFAYKGHKFNAMVPDHANQRLRRNFQRERLSNLSQLTLCDIPAAEIWRCWHLHVAANFMCVCVCFVCVLGESSVLSSNFFFFIPPGNQSLSESLETWPRSDIKTDRHTEKEQLTTWRDIFPCLGIFFLQN